MNKRNIHLELSAELAWALAQLVKRISYSDCRSLAVDDRETQQMIEAINQLQRALAEAGYAPR